MAKTMTEAEQIAKVCEWLGVDVPAHDNIVHGYYDPVMWWSREGWWRALEAWCTRDGDRTAMWQAANGDSSGCTLHICGPGTLFHTYSDTPSAAALAALTEAMEHE